MAKQRRLKAAPHQPVRHATSPTPGAMTALALVVLVSSVVLSPKTADLFNAFKFTGETLLSSDTYGPLLRQIRTPGAGEEMLPPPVRVMLYLLRSNGVSTFTYSETIASDENIRQRLIEGAFPIRWTPEAHHRLVVDGEPLPAGSVTVASWGGIILVRCP